MTALSRALATLEAGLGEVRSTLVSRAAQVDGIAAVARIIMPVLNDYAQEKDQFDAALQARRAALDSFYRGLFVISVSSFEGFVKSFVSALVQVKCSDAKKFSDLSEDFRNRYVARMSQVLANIGSGSVKGIPYNFAALQKSVGICFTDSGRPILDGEVFTVLMGNPTWARLISLLEAVGISEPFDQSFGSSEHVKGWGKTNWKKNLSDAQKKLDELMDQRNLIVHAAQPKTIVEQDIVDACDFFEAIAKGLTAEMPNRI